MDAALEKAHPFLLLVSHTLLIPRVFLYQIWFLPDICNLTLRNTSYHIADIIAHVDIMAHGSFPAGPRELLLLNSTGVMM